MQVGEGSDEEFCGYDSYMGYLRLYRRYWQPFRRLPAPAQRAAAALARWGSAMTGKAHVYSDIIDRAAQRSRALLGRRDVLLGADEAPLAERS